MSEAYREWIPCREQLPGGAGIYITLVTALLDGERLIKTQRYEPQAHPAFNGWTYGRTTHWRPK